MFQGEHQNQLDAKGRVSVPAAFRDALARHWGMPEIVIARWPYDPCLAVWPVSEWERFRARLDARPSSPQKRAFQRVVFGSATELVPDRQGRVLLPQPLREYAGLEREVRFVGAGETFQIWDAARWREQLEKDLELARGFEWDG